MAIDRQKLLPGSGALMKRQQTASASNRSTSTKSSFADNIKNVEVNLVNIDSFLKSKFKSESKQLDDDIKANNTRRRNLVTNRKKITKNTEGILKNLKSGLGIRDRLNNFITWTIAGYLVDRLFPLIPDLVKFTERLKPAFEFLEDFAGNVIKGTIDFIDFGYDAYEKIKGFALDIVPDDLEKKLGDFDQKFNTFMNLAFIAAMLGTGGSGPGRRPPRRPTGGQRPGGTTPGGPGGARTNTRLNSYLNRTPQFKSIQNKYGYEAAKFFQSRRDQGRSISGALNDVRSRFKPVPSTSGLNPRTAAPGGLFNRGISRTAQRTSLRLLGRGGTAVARGIFKRIPVLGPLIDFVFSLAMGEPLGRAAAKSVGAGIGMALGTLIPVPFAGSILGGVLGDIVGGALYDTVKGMVDKRKEGVTANQTGGRPAQPPTTTPRTAPQAQRQTAASVRVTAGDVEDFWTLVAVAAREDSDPQGWADVAQSVYNRAASGAYGSTKVRDLILGRMQYEPTWKFPYDGARGTPNVEWQSIKDAQTAAAAAGLAIDEINRVANALLDPSLQQKARTFIGGRTDFKGATIKFPGSIQRKAGDNNFGWQYNYRGRKIGLPINVTVERKPVPTTGGLKIQPPPPVPKGKSGLLKIIEYLTGDRSSAAYRSDHAGQNYHDHLAFDSKESRNYAIQFLRGRGWTIGSMNDGKHAKNSYHYVDQAFDIPFYPNQANKGFTDDEKGETALSGALRRDLLEGGFIPGESVAFKEGGYLTRHKMKGLNSVASYDDVEVEYIIQPIVERRLIHKTTPVLSGGSSSGGTKSKTTHNPYRS